LVRLDRLGERKKDSERTNGRSLGQEEGVCVLNAGEICGAELGAMDYGAEPAATSALPHLLRADLGAMSYLGAMTHGTDSRVQDWEYVL
jgi:hypothetical protein